MHGIITIARNDLSAVLKDPGLRISLFVVPIIMTIFLGLANSGGAPQAGTIDVVRADPSDAFAVKFVDLLRTEAGKRFTVCDLSNADKQPADCNLADLKPGADLRAAAEERIKNSTTLAGLIFPGGFGSDVQTGKNVALEYIGQSGLNAPALVRQKVDAVLTRVNGAILAARVVTDQAAPPADQRPAFYSSVYTSAEALWASEPVQIVEQTNTGGDASAGSGFGQSAPGMGAMFVMINALGLATVFITERETWTLQRLMVLPVARWQILAGKLLGRYLLGVITFAIMLLVGTLFGVRWGDWPGVIVTVLVYTLAVTAMALAFSTLVRSAGQARGIALLVALTLAPLGGAWWPLSIVPPWMQTLGRISPIAWSQEAFSKMIFYGGHLVDVLPYLGVLLVFAAVFFAFGVRRFRYE